MRASSSTPHSYVSSRSIVAPRKRRDCRAYSSRPTASFSLAAGASSRAEELRELVVGDARARSSCRRGRGRGMPAAARRRVRRRRRRSRRSRCRWCSGAIWVTTSITWRRGRDDALRDALAQRRDVAVDRGGQRLEARRDDGPVVGGGGGHEVEHRRGCPAPARRSRSGRAGASCASCSSSSSSSSRVRSTFVTTSMSSTGVGGGQRGERLARRLGEALAGRPGCSRRSGR